MPSKKIHSKIALNIKKLKSDRGWSQSDLAKKTDLAYHTIAKIENGATTDPRIKTVKKIADAFLVHVDDLLK